jgi:hypothetical protein
MIFNRKLKLTFAIIALATWLTPVLAQNSTRIPERGCLRLEGNQMGSCGGAPKECTETCATSELCKDRANVLTCDPACTLCEDVPGKKIICRGTKEAPPPNSSLTCEESPNTSVCEPVSYFDCNRKCYRGTRIPSCDDAPQLYAKTQCEKFTFTDCQGTPHECLGRKEAKQECTCYMLGQGTLESGEDCDGDGSPDGAARVAMSTAARTGGTRRANGGGGSTPGAVPVRSRYCDVPGGCDPPPSTTATGSTNSGGSTSPGPTPCPNVIKYCNKVYTAKGSQTCTLVGDTPTYGECTCPAGHSPKEPLTIPDPVCP